MAYLRYFDYYLRAQDANIKQWIADNSMILTDTERVAQQEVRSYLVQKYEIDAEFSDTKVFSNTDIYNANARIELNYSAWVEGVYAVGDYVKYTNGKVYRCIQITTDEAPTDTDYWTEIGLQNTMFYLAYPCQVFSQDGDYLIGDRVFWKNKIYTCKIQTEAISHDEQLQSIQYSNVRTKNIYPDDRQNGLLYWGHGVPYSVTGLVPNFTTADDWDDSTTYAIGDRVTFDGLIWRALAISIDVEPSSDITKWQSETWVEGDSRDALIVRCIVDLTIWSVMPRIAMRSVPKMYEDNYNWSKQWLVDCAAGNVTPVLPEKQLNAGNRIRWGGNVKHINGY